MSKNLLLLIFFLSGIQLIKAQETKEITIGTVHQIHSDQLNEDREYWVNLPESYLQDGSSYKRYPLLILLDGNAHFRSITGMVNYMSTGYNGNRVIPEMIVVSIQNVDRRRDFTPDKIITVRENTS